MPRPAGMPKTGGRKKGIPNKASTQRAQEIAASGLTPLDYLIAVMRNEGLDLHQRVDAAKAAAPYIHPKLASVEHKGDADNPIAFAILSAVPRADEDDDVGLNGYGDH
jgi:hypothetical protein